MGSRIAVAAVQQGTVGSSSREACGAGQNMMYSRKGGCTQAHSWHRVQQWWDVAEG